MNQVNNEQIYVLAYFDGFERNWLSKQPIDFDDTFWGKVQFLEEKKVKLFALPNVPELSDNELKNKAKVFFLRLYVQHIKKGVSASAPFFFDVLEIQNHNTLQMNLNESICMKEEIKICRFHSDGSPITKEEFEKEQNEIAQKRMKGLIQEMLGEQIYLRTTTKQKGASVNNLILMEKVFQVEDRVIRYCMLYDWLYSLIGNQDGTSAFIKASTIFDELRRVDRTWPPLEKERFNSAKNKNKTQMEDIFTFCRNEIGHSATDILGFSESTVLGYIDFLIGPLFRILLEKIEGDSRDGQAENGNL